MPFFQVNAIEFDFADDEINFSLDQQEEVINDTLLSVWFVSSEGDLVDTIADSTGWCVKSIDYDICGEEKSVIYKEIVEINGSQYEIRTCDYTECVRDWITDGVLATDESDRDIVDYVKDDARKS